MTHTEALRLALTELVALEADGKHADECAIEAWERARAALAAPSVPSEPVAKMSSVAHRKARDLIASGYTVVGYVMEKEGDRAAIQWDAAVRWITPPERYRLMHVEQSLTVAAPQPAPAGWRLVPVEPTPEMLAAGAADGRTVNGRPLWKLTGDVQACERYRAMLAAAPTAPEGD